MRKQKRVEIQDGERSLTFLIEEMPATKLERFIIKAGLLACGSGAIGGLLGGVDIAEVRKQAQSGDANAVLLRLGSVFKSGNFAALGDIDPEKLDDLLNDLMKCCTYVNGQVSTRMSMENVDTVIETLPALFALQKEAAALNFDFLAGGVRLLPEDGEAQRAQTSSSPRIAVRR